MLDGPVEPVKIATTVLFEGVVEHSDCFQKMADFQKALEQWLLETGQPVEISYSEVAFGDPPGEEA